MPRLLRAEVFDAGDVGVVHCVQRCVRRAFLAGDDPVSGKNFDYRREWIRSRMERLASVFGIDVLTYAILSNHMHVVLRNRPDVVASWSDKDVAIRWLRVFPGRRLDENLAEPTEVDVEMLINNPERLALVRRRLSDPSWFMRALSEPIARMANKQDECTGSFWEGRFKAQRITDEAGLLACSMYVDLNPVRAAMAASPQESKHTSAFDRIGGTKGDKIRSAAAELTVISREEAASTIKSSTPEQMRAKRKSKASRRSDLILRDAWLSPLTIDERSTDSIKPSHSGVRASDKGFLSMKLEEYLKLLTWTGKQGRSMKPSKIPSDMQPILGRLRIDSTMWSDLVWNFKKYFGRSSSAGSPESLRESARKHNRQFVHGVRSAAVCFGK